MFVVTIFNLFWNLIKRVDQSLIFKKLGINDTT